jgi:hypothetical protein
MQNASGVNTLTLMQALGGKTFMTIYTKYRQKIQT